MFDHLSPLRAALLAQSLDGFLVPLNDEFMGEYVPDSAKRLTWLTGFTGSAGLAVVLTGSSDHGGAQATTSQGEFARSANGGSVPPYGKAAFFTDGRYTLQAKAEVHGFELYNTADLTPESWITQNAGAGAVIGYDPRLHTPQSIRRYEKTARSVSFRPLSTNPIDVLWHNRPQPPATRARIHALKYAGESSDSKRARLAKIIAKDADVAVLAAPDSICWLLNIRGSDVPYTPLLLCYALLDTAGGVSLYISPSRITPEVQAHLGPHVLVRPPSTLAADLATLTGKRVMLDAANVPIWFEQRLTAAGAAIVEATDPCVLPKACKNKAELAGMRAAHLRDGLAVTKFLHWLSGVDKKNLTEMDVAAKLESFRTASKLYLEPSFTTISGSGPNGAIVHYRVTPQTNRKLDKNSLLLVDSGGQYPDGTTDITRTMALGMPSAEMKDRFTRVLKGHIALARAVFPEGTTGSQLDSLARQYLWAVGCDYDHGTGHGVGGYLSVHEGPQRIGKRGGDAALAAGMIVSNEPGYYKAGGYGIRIENLVVVREVAVTKGKRYFGFETITLAPIDLKPVNMKLLTTEEKSWLAAYHKAVYAAHAPHLDAGQKRWLKKATSLL